MKISSVRELKEFARYLDSPRYVRAAHNALSWMLQLGNVVGGLALLSAPLWAGTRHPDDLRIAAVLGMLVYLLNAAYAESSRRWRKDNHVLIDAVAKLHQPKRPEAGSSTQASLDRAIELAAEAGEWQVVTDLHQLLRTRAEQGGASVSDIGAARERKG